MSKELEAYIEYISVIKGLSAASIEAYTLDLNSIESGLEKDLIDLSELQVFNFLASIKNRRTLNRKLSALNAFYDFCLKKDFLQEQHKFRLSKVPKHLPKYLEIDAILKGLEMIDTSKWNGLRDYALILFLFATGMRISEALQIEKADINENWVKVRFAKGEKERMVPIADEALEALHHYLEVRPKEHSLLWINYQGKALSRISAFKLTQKYLGVSPHVLRHSYATAMILGGADLRVVQELLGHASMLTTQIYTHIEKEVLRDTVLRCHPLKKEDL
ncbi:MAG: tyrosine-type recombinase/integrase [Thiovulaceae bacterium]|nr:tyrosine-type recombinase/integrase [Sulfurimonadaceae bacterium]